MKRFFLICLLCAAGELLGQTSGNVTMLLYPNAPTGSCSARQLAMNQSNGSLYTCNNGSWQALGTGGGGGGLNGCNTNTAGQLVCNTSVQGGTGTSGMLTLPYTGGLPSPPTASQAAIAANATGVFWSPGNSTAFSQLGTGGGGGGWNPPNAPGDTLFGNNTVSTGPPSFFIPGGDTSFSAGQFWVNRLHFGPTVLNLTNTGIASGNFLQISGSAIIGAPAPGGGGGGTQQIGGVTELTATGSRTALTADQMQSLILTNNGGSSYFLPNTQLSPATDWCTWVMPSGTGTYQLTSPAGTDINNQSAAITVPPWQMTRICQGNAGNFWVNPPFLAGSGITLTPGPLGTTISTAQGAAISKVAGGTVNVGDGSVAVDPNSCANLVAVPSTSSAPGVQQTDVILFTQEGLTGSWGNGQVILRPLAYAGAISWRACNVGTVQRTPTAVVTHWMVIR